MANAQLVVEISQGLLVARTEPSGILIFSCRSESSNYKLGRKKCPSAGPLSVSDIFYEGFCIYYDSGPE